MQLGDLVPADVSLPDGARTIDIRGITADSRAVSRDFLFAALPGTQTDGARFVREAAGKGAAAILASREAEFEIDRPVVRAEDPRRALALIAAKFHPRQPNHIVAVTGTSGKTSIADFARQIFATLGHPAASIGTLGVVTAKGTEYGTHTTPDPVALHATLDRLAREGITHAAIEASSQGLDQRRLDGVRIEAAAFTNLGRDHMDYHPTVEAYLAAKMRVFDTILPETGTAVIDMDGARASDVEAVAKKRGQKLIRVGKAGTEIKLTAVAPKDFRQRLSVNAFGKPRDIVLSLPGAFQASNALVAAGLAIAAGIAIDDALGALAKLTGAPGRLELAGSKGNGALVFIDYAHKPDALASALQALRPMTRGLLYVVFGAGGDRDSGKRPLMGKAAADNADVVIVTDDNPRSENPAIIREQIVAAAPDAIEVADRADAIRKAIAMLGADDVLCVAGKGHETGQIVGSLTIPFSDHEAVAAALAAEEFRVTAPLWTYDAFLEATKGRRQGAAADAVTGISIDTRTLAPGDAFFAIKGDTHDGHDFASTALAKGASTAVVEGSHLAGLGRSKGCLTIVPDVLDALRHLGAAARARSTAGIVAVTGSVGKTGTKEMLAAALAPDGAVHYSPASFNNHWGVPLTLSRMPADVKYGVFEIGMNHAGEIEPLVKLVRPQVAIITTVEPVHLEYFKDVKQIARAKAEIFLGIEKGGAAILNRDNPHHALLAKLAKEAGVERIVGFGEHPKAELRLETVKLKEACSCVSASILGAEVSYKLGAPGRHLVQNSLAVLGAVSILGADLARAMLALTSLRAPKGRGERHILELGRKAGAITLIDESYNANPASMAAAIALLGQSEPTKGGRRIAVLGDMRELGATAPAMHAALAEPLAAAGVTTVFLAGPMMQSLWEALPKHQRGGYAETAAELEPVVIGTLAPGDVVMVKGSNASRMGPLVEALKARFAPDGTRDEQRQEQETA